MSRLELPSRSGQLIYPVPQFTAPVVTGGDGIDVLLAVHTTQASFHDVYSSRLERVVRTALHVYWTVYCYPATTGETRLQLTGPGGTFTSGVTSCAANGYTYAYYRWLHGYPVWDPSIATFSIQTRRTSGASEVVTFPSFNGVEQVGPKDATLTGL